MGSLWVPAYVAIGSNLDDPVVQVRDAIGRLGSLPGTRLIAHSRLFRTTPLGPQEQPDFVNAAAGLLTQLSAHELLVELKRLERTMGRAEPVVRWGPRRIDFDLLVFGVQQIREPDLTVPHPGVPVRNFVLYPLRDIAPDLLVPGHAAVAVLAARVDDGGISPVT